MGCALPRPVPSPRDSSSAPQPPASNPWDRALRLVYASGSSTPLRVPAALTLGARQAVERLEASGFSHDKDNHSYPLPVSSQGLPASLTHREVVGVVVRSLGSGAEVESQNPYFSNMCPWASSLVFSICQMVILHKVIVED